MAGHYRGGIDLALRAKSVFDTATIFLSESRQDF